MNRLKWVAGLSVAVGLSAAAFCASDGPAASAPPAESRVVILGFDGAGYNLAQQFMSEGRMPNCKKLGESGTFLPLGSSNPAESPVAWASINTGQNPGKTNIFGFIRRNFRWLEDPAAPGGWKGYIAPAIGYSREVDKSVNLAGGDVLMSVVENDLRCPNFWDVLDQAGVASRILQAACNFPATGGKNTKLLAGLSVPDVRGGPGTYFSYTNSEWEFPRDTNTGGRVEKFKVVCGVCGNKGFNFTKGCTKCADKNKDKIGKFETRLYGPDNFVERQQWSKKVADLRKVVEAAKDAAEKQKAQKELNTASLERKKWDDERGFAFVPLSGVVDRAARTITFKLADREIKLKEGEWSEYVPAVFQVVGAFPVKAAVHLHLSQCNDQKDDLRFYLPAITAAADECAPNSAVTSPKEFGKELVSEVGYFDTIGWSCQTHALKDDELSEASFLSAIWDTIQWRRKMLDAQLAQPDWRVLFQVFGETDRVSHMMYRFFDPDHPQYKAEDAEKKVHFGDREIMLKEAIPAVYAEVDKTIGSVLAKIEAGQLGDCTLMVCSDHGFSSFREEVELNAWLIEAGFLGVKTEAGQPVTTTAFPSYIDWSKTRAYSMGLGMIFINLKGREPDGIVEPADYDKTCDEIIAAMLKYKNSRAETKNDPHVFVGGWKRSQFVTPPYGVDLRDPKNGKCVEGSADIQVGLNLGYRVGWGTALGDRAKGVPVFPNKSKWSGDHTSVHPYLVRGIFFCTKKVGDGTLPHLQDLAPTTIALLGVKVPDDMDGHVLPLPGLEKAAADHKGGTANRESLLAPQAK